MYICPSCTKPLNWQAREASEPHSGLFNRKPLYLCVFVTYVCEIEQSDWSIELEYV